MYEEICVASLPTVVFFLNITFNKRRKNLKFEKKKKKSLPSNYPAPSAWK